MAEPTLPSAGAEPERYAGRRLLIVIENYILDAIGHLEPEKQRIMTDIVQHTFGGGSDWKATIRRELEWPEAADLEFQKLWQRNQVIAKEQGLSLHPVQFAKMVADTNFTHHFAE